MKAYLEIVELNNDVVTASVPINQCPCKEPTIMEEQCGTDE